MNRIHNKTFNRKEGESEKRSGDPHDAMRVVVLGKMEMDPNKNKTIINNGSDRVLRGTNPFSILLIFLPLFFVFFPFPPFPLPTFSYKTSDKPS